MDIFLQSQTDELIKRGIEEAQQGRRETAYRYFLQARQNAPQNEILLMWISAVTDNVYEAVQVLEQVIALNPQNEQAIHALEWARSRQAEVDSLVNGFMSRSNIGDQAVALRNDNVQKTVRHIGQLLVDEGYITAEQLAYGLEQHQTILAQGHHYKLGEVLIALNFLTLTQLQDALRYQRQEIDKGFHD